MEPPSEAVSAVRVLLADDDRFVRSALLDLLSSSDGIEVVGDVEDGRTALSAARSLKPDVVVVDLHMAHGGPDLVRTLRAERPGTSVICFSADSAGTEPMLAAGAFAYALKGDPDVDLVDLVLRAAQR